MTTEGPLTSLLAPASMVILSQLRDDLIDDVKANTILVPRNSPTFSAMPCVLKVLNTICGMND